MSESDDRIAHLRQLFDRYLALPRRSGDSAFHDRLLELQHWEAEDIRRRHAALCSDNPHYAGVLGYYLDCLHDGLNLEGMVARGPGALENARKLNRAYPLFANAIEFSVLSATAQDRLVEVLGDSALTATKVASALRKCGDLDLRERRLDVLVEIGQQVAPHISSRMIHTGFRLLKGIFRSSGMEEMHSILDDGFRRLRDVPRLAQTLADIAEKERSWLVNQTRS